MYHWLAEGIGRRGKGIIPLERAGSPFVQVRWDGEEEIIPMKRMVSPFVQVRRM